MKTRQAFGDEQPSSYGAIRRNPDHNKAAAASATKVVCLLAHDLSMRKALTRLIESASYKVREFSDAQAFLTFVASNFAAVAVLDTWTERMTATELLAQTYAKSPTTTVIVMNERGYRPAQTTALKHGIVESLMKPLDGDKFLTIIGRALAT
jgi:FixJ family two-component response regulator